MAAARVNIPTIVVTAGAMHSGNYRGNRVNLITAFEAVGKVRKGEMSRRRTCRTRDLRLPGRRLLPGHVHGEHHGLRHRSRSACAFPGCATALAVSGEKRRIAFDSGKRIVGMVKEDLTPRKIMTRNAFENAIRIDMALGGSTNTTLHIPAIAHEAGIERPHGRCSTGSAATTPHLCSMLPGGPTTWKTSMPRAASRRFCRASRKCSSLHRP